MKLMLPDSCWRRDLASGALFLYFCDGGISTVLHASVSTFLTGIDPFEFFRLVEARQPSWASDFFKFAAFQGSYRASLAETGTLLEPFRKKVLKSTWIIYERGSSAWQAAADLVSSSSLSPEEIWSCIDPFAASDELFSHIFFSKCLELYFPERKPEELFSKGAEILRAGNPPARVEVDWADLYQYCNEFFGSSSLRDLLTRAYMFRIPLLQRVDSVLLTNERLVTFLASLPVESATRGEKDMSASQSLDDPLDPVAWEFFRQLVSPMVDPLDERRVQKVLSLTENKAEEIRLLKSRCLSLARELGTEVSLPVLQSRITSHLRLNVEKEVQALLGLEKSAVGDLLTEVFSDEKTWLGISALLFSLVNGGLTLTAGSAICALSLFGSKAVKVAAEHKQKLKASDYILLYRLNRL